MISVCDFFIRRERADIAQELVKEFYISREECAGQGFDGFDLSAMDRYGVFEVPAS
ncbi:MAG: hypothetical protein LBG27_12900 [Spirochaetaceae bacterium]|jgi:3-deoxy-D-manno-octulosonate 8-phosphate phosphatase KdsC-like HAD superfamily phosphatase|nr:hypothetical protein [Spirochaetaceae bacterium]